MPTTPPTKICNTCHESKPLTEFNKNIRSADGHTYKCRNCYRIYRQENAARIATYRQNHYKKTRHAHNEQSRKDRARRQALTKQHSYAVGMNWDKWEDALLMADNNLTLLEKAIQLGRTYAACVTRKTRLNKETTK